MFHTQFEEAEGVSFVTDIRPGVLETFEAGPIGWCQDNPIFVMPDGSELLARVTAVLQLEGMSWRIVQVHWSFGRPNVETFGKLFTTSLQAIAESIERQRPDLSASAAIDGTLTIVFTDIEGSTNIAEHLGDADFLDLIRWHDEVVRNLAQANVGQVVKSQGDGYMLVFASAKSALEFSALLREESNQEFRGMAIKVRIGLNSGDVLRERNDFFGHAVTLAARVAAQAVGGEILATDIVASLVAGDARFSFGATRSIELKGFKDLTIVRPLNFVMART
jgi:class 3 adenylate cyclase